MKKHVKAFFLFLLLLLFDQLTKYLAVVYLKNQAARPIIMNIFELTYVENRGAAFGILSNQVTFFIIISTVMIAAILGAYCYLSQKGEMVPVRLSLIFLLSGAVGNLLDRIVHQYVIDFLYFKLIDFPVFNIADCYVTISLFFIMFYVLFVYKEGETK
ncbi:MAG: signal peptidase II [Lachnospiraceae bacterium]